MGGAGGNALRQITLVAGAGFEPATWVMRDRERGNRGPPEATALGFLEENATCWQLPTTPVHS